MHCLLLIIDFSSVPRLFVNVHFTDISDRTTYVGGKRRPANYINARVRLGNRTSEEFQQLTRSLEEAWEKVVIRPLENDERKREYQLQTVIVVPTNHVGLEVGFELPTAGNDGQWLKTHFEEFGRRVPQLATRSIMRVGAVGGILACHLFLEFNRVPQRRKLKGREKVVTGRSCRCAAGMGPKTKNARKL